MGMREGKCDRCKKSMTESTVSYFNTQEICMDCDEIERAHPDFQAAREKETQEVMQGNMNFPGVGLPADLR